jgi:ABC-type glycerol-3-phosphate transport system substrate-binding protein
MKKIAACLLAGVLMVSSLTGCGAKLPDEVTSNDVLSMTPLSSDKMTITVRAEFGINNTAMEAALKAKFPDANIAFVFHCAKDTQYELRQSLASGTAEDLVISLQMKTISDAAPDCLLDLSGDNFVSSYDGAALENAQVGGKLYYLPGPSTLYGIVYDRTMFEQNGWKIPQSYSEFLSLVKTIDDTGIRAIQPTCAFNRPAEFLLTMFNYADVFSGVENTAWLRSFQNGSASMAGHLETALDRYSELQKAGVVKATDFDVQPGDRSTMLYNEHSCAMIIDTEQAERYAKEANSDHEYGMMPFWSGDGENDDYLMSIPSYYIGLNKKLGEKGNEKKLALAKEILSYISTPEGQLAIAGGTLSQISNVQGTSYTESDFNAGVQSTIKKGNLAPEVDLMASGNNNAAQKALVKDLRSYLEGSVDAATVVSDVDSARDVGLATPLDRGEKLGSAKTTFSVAETGLFIADALKQKAGADVGLCLVGTTNCGMTSRLYAGDIYTADVNTLSLSLGSAASDKDDKKLWLVSMTGEELKGLLEQALTFHPDKDVPSDPYYVASGLNIKFAPWQDEKLLSVKLANGKDLDSKATYSVALWGWPYKTECPGTVTKEFDDSCDDILAAAVKSDGELSPFTDGRFTIVY